MKCNVDTSPQHLGRDVVGGDAFRGVAHNLIRASLVILGLVQYSLSS